MATINADAYRSRVEAEHLAAVKAGLPPFKAQPFYLEDADAIVFCVREGLYYRKRISSTITLYLSMKDDRLAGFEVKGVSRLLKLQKEFGVLVVDHKIKLGVCLAVGLVEVPEKEIDQYRQELEQYKDVDVPEAALAAAV